MNTFSELEFNGKNDFVRRLQKDLEEAVLKFRGRECEEGMITLRRRLPYFDLKFVESIFKHVYYKFKRANFSEEHQLI